MWDSQSIGLQRPVLLFGSESDLALKCKEIRWILWLDAFLTGVSSSLFLLPVFLSFDLLFDLFSFSHAKFACLFVYSTCSSLFIYKAFVNLRRKHVFLPQGIRNPFPDLCHSIWNDKRVVRAEMRGVKESKSPFNPNTNPLKYLMR